MLQFLSKEQVFEGKERCVKIRKSHLEIKKNAHLLAQAWRDKGNLFSALNPDVLKLIATFTGNPGAHNLLAAQKIAEKSFGNPSVGSLFKRKRRGEEYKLEENSSSSREKCCSFAKKVHAL